MKYSEHICQTLVLYRHRYRSRKALARLNNSQLSDIGLTKEEAREEADRPFWVGASDGYKQVLLKRAKAENAFEQRNKQLIEV